MRILTANTLIADTLKNVSINLTQPVASAVKMFLTSAPDSYGSKDQGADVNLNSEFFSRFITYSTSRSFSQGLDGFSVRGGCLQGYVNVQGDGLDRALSTNGWSS